MIAVVTFKWGSKFSSEDVNRLARQVRKNLWIPHLFFCFTDDPTGLDQSIRYKRLWRDYLNFGDGCYARLKLFGPEASELLDGADAWFWLDLDALIVGPLEDLVDELLPHNVALATGLHFLPIINGSFVWNKTGTEPDVWEKFDLNLAHEIATTTHSKYLGTDQSWLDYMLPFSHKVDQRDGLWAYRKSQGWPKDNSLPDGAKIVFFPGRLHDARTASKEATWLAPFLI